MSGLEDTFEGRVDFIMLDWDDSSFDEIRQQLGITDRTQYVLVAPDGSILQRWYGILNEESVANDIETYLTS